MSDTQKMGFVGLGNMGRHMAGHLLEAGYDLTVFDLDPAAVKGLTDKGAKASESVAALAGEVDVLFTALPGPPQVRAVALGDDGVIANAKSGSVYVDLTTNNPEVTREVYAAGKERGVSVIDAAMSGGMHGAESRRLSLMVGGDEDVAEKLRPALETMSDNVVYCGESGAGTVTKVVNNFVSLTESALLGEALAMGVKWGVKLDTLADVIGESRLELAPHRVLPPLHPGRQLQTWLLPRPRGQGPRAGQLARRGGRFEGRLPRPLAAEVPRGPGQGLGQ